VLLLDEPFASLDSITRAEMQEWLAAALAAEPRAQAMFETLSRQNRYAVLYRVATAKRPETRARRIERFVTMLARGETIYPQKGS
jgi:uncharacterized protein YdeI (YjbR/CyaY-like superfamily)